MSSCLVMVPVTPARLAALRRDARLDDVAGFAPNDALAQTFGVPPGEEAEAAALQMADVAGLAAGGGRRCVLVAQVPEADVRPSSEEADNGAVVVATLPLRCVTAFFTGGCDERLAGLAAGRTLDDLWQEPAVRAMLASEPLSWHDGTELDGWPDD